jgi:hypothetical protein
MSKNSTPKGELLDQLLALDRSEAWDIGSAVYDTYGESGYLPTEWADPLIKACLDDSRSREQRLQFMYQLVRLPPPVVTKTIGSHLYLDQDLVKGAIEDGDDYALLQHLDELLPGFGEVPAVNQALGMELFDAVAGTRGKGAVFSPIDDDIIDWIENPNLVPLPYDIPNTCASCTSFYPRAITEEGVLGECAQHSANIGLCPHIADCEDWTERTDD